MAARLNGRIDFLRLETYNQGRQIDWGFMSAYRRSKYSTYVCMCSVHCEYYFTISSMKTFFCLQHTYELVQLEAYQIRSYLVQVKMI